MTPAAIRHHFHGLCRTCKARRTSLNLFCPECGNQLQQAELHEPHEANEVIGIGGRQ